LKKHYNILYLCLEFDKWNLARPWTYQSNLGIEEGFSSNNLTFLTVTTPWLGQIRELCRECTFDQVWVEIVHQNISEDLFDWLKTISRVRIGLIFESLTNLEEQSIDNKLLNERYIRVREKLKYLSHVISVDEIDAKNIAMEFGIPTFWWPSCMPERYVKILKTNNKINKAVFSGTLYGLRVNLIKEAQLENLVVFQSSPDRNNFYHFVFDFIHIFRSFITYALPKLNKLNYCLYILILRISRRKNYSIYLNSISQYSIVLNLPSIVRAYPGRVTEAMSVGSVVISNLISDRPQNQTLFEDKKEILIYNSENIREFISSIKFILKNDELRRKISNNAFNCIKKSHTVEIRVSQVLEWLSLQE
jgi:hypothetical protein